MPTTKKRINITLSSELEKALQKIAHRDKVPEATKAAELIKIALEIEEDAVWALLAEERMKSTGDYISHDNAWKK